MKRRQPMNPGELRRFEGLTGKVQSITFSPDGQFVLSGSNSTLCLWDASTGQEVRRFNPDEDRVVRVGPTQKTDDYHRSAGVGTTGGVFGVGFSADGRLALSGNGDSTLRLWEVATGQELKRFHGYNREINAVAFSPDGKFALSGGYCYMEPPSWTLPPNLRLWDLDEGREVYALSEHMMVYTVAFSPDGSLIASAGDDHAPRLGETRDGREVRRFRGHTCRGCLCVFFPDGERLLSGGADQTLRIWEVASGREIACLTGHTSSLTCVAVSPDGRLALSGSKDKTVRYWDLEGQRELLCLTGHKGRVSGVAFSPDGRTALSCGWDRTIRLWELPD